MGLGFEVRANRRRTALFGLSSKLVTLEELERALRTRLAGTPFETETSAEYLDGGRTLAFVVHPAGEPLFLEIDGDNLTANAKTSNVGPGYHHFLIECLDHLQKALGLQWQWDEGAEDASHDDTDYAYHRDFDLLQEQMVSHFKNLYQVVSDNFGPGSMINMPADGWFETEYDVLTPLGPVTLESVHKTLTLPDGDLEAAAISHFPWWNKGFDGEFYRGLALCSFWMRIRWAEPLDEAEEQYIQQVLEWCDKAAELGARPPLPADGVETLRNIMGGIQAPAFAEPMGIGYRRHSVRRFVAGNWRLSFPGSLRIDVEDGGDLVMWNAVMSIRASASAYTRKGGTSASVKDEIADLLGTKVEFFKSGDEDDGYCLQVVAQTLARRGSLEVCVLTIWLADPSLRGKAEEIAGNLTFDDPDERPSSGTLH